MTVSTLTEKLEGTGAKGSSYGSVWAYLKKPDSAAPPMEFFDAAGGVLRVRPAWLAFGDGSPTEAEERARVRAELEPKLAHEQATRAAVFEAFGRETAGLGRVIGVETPDILPSVATVAHWLGQNGLDLPGLEDEEGDHEGHRRYVEAARLLGRAVMAPLEILHLEPAYWTNGAKAQYLAHAVPTLATLTDLEHGLGALVRAKYEEKPEGGAALPTRARRVPDEPDNDGDDDA